ncbi:MAG: HAMP domain-containing histidine kinase [Lachnospiraceae bacterium]|nr:HAMP domain-containing histidine kinase [Butyrivibrio sp.]MCM1344756.1 HAMP domain-containing histidine kinase [Muribaculaceae bacterium]MCM1409118.1 HAMP domain-containing histidine kinase [Lachnospiraceae bacterium]
MNERTRFYWNKEIKCLMGMFALIFFMGGLCGNLVMERYCSAVNREFNLAVASMLDSVVCAYPDASEEQLLTLLDERQDSGAGERLLGQYGIFLQEKGSAFTGLKERETGFRGIWTIVYLVVGAFLFGILFLYLRHRQKEIGKLCGYMDEVERGNFSLDISHNRDDEFSGLKNELYKLTIFLKEQAKMAIDNRKALADAVADISHQLKTPLTSVTVLVDDLWEHQDMEPAVRNRFLREISSQISGVSWLIATLLKLSRLDAGVVELEHKPLSVRALTEKVCHKLELLAEWRQVELDFRIPGEIWINGDEQWLTEALLNLVKNAIEHSIPGGEVLVTAEENDVYTLVTVQDHGEGISPEEQKHLFERFYRGRLAGADSVGIGLSLAKEIIVRQEGYITVDSDKERGTAFLIKFIKCH